MNLPTVRTWIEINKKALHSNVERFLRLIPKDTHFMAVIKSNAYGHGLTLIAKILSGYKLPATSCKPVWFGADSITEGLKLRCEGIKNTILILGYTIPSLFKNAFENNLAVSIADFVSLSALNKLKNKPKFFIKLDSGMHRRGFLPEETEQLLALLKNKNLQPLGIFSHFASASDTHHRDKSEKQIQIFKDACNEFKKAGFKDIIKSLAATGGALFYPEACLDMVRIGMGIYGYPPSLEIKNSKLQPVLTWKTFISEIKEIPAGSFVGYSFSHRVRRKSKIAVLPIGYWHGYDRRLSNKSEVLVRGRRAPVIGLVSMDMVVVDITGIDKIKVGDEVVLIGRQGKEAIWADELARKINCNHYELLTRINPLIKRTEV